MELPTITKISVYFTILMLLLGEVYCGELNKQEEECIKEFVLNKETIEAWNIEPQIPDDDYDLQQYMSCYWKKLGYINNHGSFNFDELFRVMHGDLRKRFHFNCSSIVNYMLVKCKDTVNSDSEGDKAQSDGVKAIRMWNCLNNFAENLF